MTEEKFYLFYSAAHHGGLLQWTYRKYCHKDWFLESVMWSHLLALNNVLKWSIQAWFGIFMQIETHPWNSQRQYKYRRVDNNDVVREMLLYNTTTDKTLSFYFNQFCFRLKIFDLEHWYQPDLAAIPGDQPPISDTHQSRVHLWDCYTAEVPGTSSYLASTLRRPWSSTSGTCWSSSKSG